MISRIGRRLFAVRYPYENRIDTQRARGLLVINQIMLILSLLWLATLIVVSLADPDAALLVLLNLTPNYFVPIFAVAVYIMIQRGRLNVASWIFVGLTLVTATVALDGGLAFSTLVTLALPVAAAGSLLDRRGILVTFLLILAVIAVAAVDQSSNLTVPTTAPAETLFEDVFVTVLTVSLAMFFLYIFGGWTQIVAEESEGEVQLLRTINEFVNSFHGSDEEYAMLASLRFIMHKLGYSFAQIYLTNPDRRIIRRMRVGAGSGAASYNDEIEIGDASSVREAAQAQAVVSVSQRDSDMRRDHFLPATRSALDIPLQYGDTLIGVLDVQSEHKEKLEGFQVKALQTLADNLASHLNHVRLVEALRKNIQQQEEIAALLRVRLDELRQETHRSARALWDDYLQSRKESIFGFDHSTGNSEFIPASDLPDSMRAVLENGALQIKTEGEVKLINVPIMIQDRILGAMSFTIPKDRVLSERQIETAQIVANRLALALENRRLFEQTQAQAERERKANELSGLLIGATNVDAVMNLAASNFNDAMAAINTRIHLRPAGMSALGRSNEAYEQRST